jgi:hypothetical protein
MGMLECLDYLINVKSGTFLAEPTILLQDLIQLSIRRKVQQDVNSLFVIKEAMHGQDVGMFEVTVDFDLSSELEDNIAIDDLFFGDHLDSYDSLSFSLPCQINVSIPELKR